MFIIQNSNILTHYIIYQNLIITKQQLFYNFPDFQYLHKQQKTFKSSQTKQKILNKQMKSQKQNPPTNDKLSSLMNNPHQKTFLKYYQQNIQLKKSLEQKNQYIKDLKSKLENQMNLNKTTYGRINPYDELKALKNQNKRQESTNNKQINKTGTWNGTQNRKIENLLQIIDSYKSKLLLSQQQCANLRHQKHLLQQDVMLSKKPLLQNSSVHQKPGKNRQQQLTHRLKQKLTQLQQQKQRNLFLQSHLKSVQSKLKTTQINQDQLADLKVQNRIMEETVMKLTIIGANDQQRDYRAVQEKARELQLKLKNGIDKYDKIKQEQQRLKADYQLLKNKLVEVTYQNQELQKQSLELKKNQVNNPIIQKLIKNPDLLIKVVSQIQRSKDSYGVSGSVQVKPYHTTQKLLLQKQSLARELMSTKSRLQSLQSSFKQKQAFFQIQKQQLTSKISTQPQNPSKKTYTSKMGIPYDGDISMFSQQKIDLAKGINYFDLFLGDISIMATNLIQIIKVNDTTKALIMATVDFYNFATVNTKLVQGVNNNLHTEFTFKITQDQYFYKYLNKDSFKIDVWVAQGNKNFSLGKVQVPLKQLFSNNKPDIAPVVSSSAPIYLNNKIMGTIQFTMRMRLPIFQQTSSILSSIGVVSSQLPNARKLIIHLQSGSSFPVSSSLFVYYEFRLCDYHTKTSKGPQPRWQHYKILDVDYNVDMKNYLRKNKIGFHVFDDNAQLYDQKDNDVIGMGQLDLISLLEDKTIKERLKITKNGNIVGYIDVKIYWYQSKDKSQILNPIKKNQDMLTTIHQDVIRFIKQRSNGNAQQQFRKIDFNGTGMISFDQFNIWTTKIKQSFKYSQQIISKYYSKFRQPLNLLNWISFFQSSEVIHPTSDLVSDISQINKLLALNSVQINTQISLTQYLENKDLLQVTLDMDKDNNGKISKKEFMTYMNQHNVKVDQKEVQEEFKLYQFLKKYQNIVKK